MFLNLAVVFIEAVAIVVRLKNYSPLSKNLIMTCHGSSLLVALIMVV